MSINRRVFVRQGALALLALGVAPEFISRSLFAATPEGARKKTLICIFQRGAVDGLNMVVPFGERAYAEYRSTIAIPPPLRNGTGALDLDGFFGFHPALRPLHELYGRSELAVIHAVGSPHPTRSHFEAQDYMESGVPGDPGERTGWLNRILAERARAEGDGRTLANPGAHAVDHVSAQFALADTPGAALRGVAIGSALPLALRGAHPTLAITDLQRFGVAGGRDSSLSDTFARLYRLENGDEVTSAVDGAFDAIKILKEADPARYNPRPGVEYPRTAFGQKLRQIAQLIKADVGVETAFADLGGWDTHVGQGGVEGTLARRLSELAQGIRALYDDLGDRMEDVVILTMSEFGRTVRQNGSGGTDHGHANCMLVLGGPVAGGRILGEWPGLELEQLNEGRDLALTTDFRDVFAEVASGHLGVEALERVFPGYEIRPERWRGFLRNG